ncbi:MATE family efflux transporter [Alteromonas sp. C1M14]|uniref:MATE family efflux transporter n=1 Tax=Alteromonas sp. C1M14 TaxID=2841567 RepID=UPI001C0831C4|nr:MATE family efflux transporter [Alteromonas sp. C1M14]MBU2979304.1 MATE family efflux transporter [Alteromonas sp. C1M14]
MEDLTRGSLSRHLIKMAIPVAVGLFIQTLYFLVDLYFVGRLGGIAIAAVSSAGSLFFLILGLTQVLNIGCASLVANAVGGKDKDRASHIFNQSLRIAILATLVLGVLGYGSAGWIFTVLTADSETKRLALSYFYWFFPSLLAQFTMTVLGAGLRGTGIVKPVMIISMLGILLNILLSPILIEGWLTGLPLGVVGAGLASSIAAMLSLFLLARYCKVKDRYLTVAPFSVALDMSTVKRILNVGLPAGGEFILTFFYMSVIYWALSQFTSQAQAGFGIGIRIMQSLFLPVMAVAFAAPAVIGQNLGAGNTARIMQAYRTTATITAILMAIISIVCFFVPQLFVGKFTQDPEVILVATGFLSMAAFNFIPAGYVLAASSVFQGLGNTLPSFYSSITRMGVFALPVIYLSLTQQLAIQEIWYLSVFSVYVQALMSYLLVTRALARISKVTKL